MALRSFHQFLMYISWVTWISQETDLYISITQLSIRYNLFRTPSRVVELHKSASKLLFQTLSITCTL